MEGKVRLEGLRTAHPMTVEILVKEVFRRPVRQIDVQTLADVVAVSEIDTFSKATLKGLSDFMARARAEIADLPNGQPMREFVDALAEVEPSRASMALRAMMEEEAARETRSPALKSSIADMLAVWSEGEPHPVSLGVAAPRVVRGVAEPLRDKRIGGKVEDPVPETPRQRAAAGRTSSSSSSSKDNANKNANSARPPKPSADPERDQWIRQQVMAKLGSSTGLAEVVLIAGVVHTAKERWPGGVTAIDVKSVLQVMKTVGTARFSAGRWSSGKRW